MEKITFDKIPALQEYMAQPPGERQAWLEKQEWYRRLPDRYNGSDDRPSYCKPCDGIETCDGRGTIFEDNQARRCPRAFGHDVHERLSGEYQRLHDQLMDEHWEGWPVRSFDETRRHPRFTATTAFEAIEKLFHAIREDADPRKHQAAVIACGKNGRGKTMSGLILLYECARLGMRGYAMRFNDLVKAMKNGIDGRAAIHDFLRNLERAKVVLVDEVGKEIQGGNADHTRVAVEYIVDCCYRQRFLVMTSNLTMKELGGYFTSTVFSRMRLESGYCRTIEESKENTDLRGSGL